MMNKIISLSSNQIPTKSIYLNSKEKRKLIKVIDNFEKEVSSMMEEERKKHSDKQYLIDFEYKFRLYFFMNILDGAKAKHLYKSTYEQLLLPILVNRFEPNVRGI